jgi:nondiscriminating aspartyl-tRNA synthetase
MQRIWSVDLPAYVGEHVAVAGWLHRLRRLSSVSFLIVRDARGLAQVVVDDACLRRIEHLHPESVLRVEGHVVATPARHAAADAVTLSLHQTFVW